LALRHVFANPNWIVLVDQIPFLWLEAPAPWNECILLPFYCAPFQLKIT
jgi:hypothetical protein